MKKLEAALNYARQGLSVIPLHNLVDGKCTCKKDCKGKGKHPRVARWQEGSPATEAEITDWWTKWPDANVGIRTGNGLGVLDIDHYKPEVRTALEDLIKVHGPLPETYAVRTGSGGLHYYFTVDGDLKNATGLVPGIDFRGTGGQVVAPPSTNAQGEYTVINSAPLAPAPPWLYGALTENKKATKVKTTLDQNEGLIPEGRRDDTMAKMAGILQRYGMLNDEILDSLNDTLFEVPLEDTSKFIRQMSKKPVVHDLSSRNPFDPLELVPSHKIEATDADGNTRTRRRYVEQEVVEYWLKIKCAEYKYTTNRLKIGSQFLSLDRIVNQVLLDAREVNLPVQKTLIEIALAEWWQTKKAETIDRYRAELKHDPQYDATTEASTLIRAWTGQAGDLDVIALQHFVWQVKRKLTGRPVTDHLMMILVGKQRAGKTEAVRSLLKPIDELWSELHNLQTLADSRELGILTRNFVLFADEMGRGEKVPVDLLKAAITGKQMQQRIMRTNEHDAIIHNATIIGASNEPINEIIYDPTGMRRFWQINCLDQLDWDVINNTDTKRLWLAVDETSPSSFADKYQEFHKVQSTILRAKSSIEYFLEDGPYVIDEQGSMAASVVYENYKDFCNTNGLAASSMPKFKTKLESLGVVYKRTAVARIWSLTRRPSSLTDENPLKKC